MAAMFRLSHVAHWSAAGYHGAVCTGMEFDGTRSVKEIRTSTLGDLHIQAREAAWQQGVDRTEELDVRSHFFNIQLISQ